MIVHDARMHADMKRMLMTHHTFHFDGVFGGSASNDQVYAGTARDLVLAAAAGAGCTATVMMYGQTGSGKTFSMSAIYERATQDLFTALTADAQRGGAPVVTISFVELAGDSCLDMLNGGQSAQLLIGCSRSLLRKFQSKTPMSFCVSSASRVHCARPRQRACTMRPRALTPCAGSTSPVAVRAAEGQQGRACCSWST
jgi:hypothetical protein